MVKWCTYHVNASLDLMLQTLKMFLSGKCSFQPPFGSPAHITVCMCFQKHDFKCFWFPSSFWTWDVWVQGVNVSCFGFLIWLCETTELGLWLKLSDIHVLFVRWWSFRHVYPSKHVQGSPCLLCLGKSWMHLWVLSLPHCMMWRCLNLRTSAVALHTGSYNKMNGNITWWNILELAIGKYGVFNIACGIME